MKSPSAARPLTPTPGEAVHPGSRPAPSRKVRTASVQATVADWGEALAVECTWEGQIQGVSPQFELATGLGAGNLLGKPHASLLERADGEASLTYRRMWDDIRQGMVRKASLALPAAGGGRASYMHTFVPGRGGAQSSVLILCEFDETATRTQSDTVLRAME